MPDRLPALAAELSLSTPDLLIASSPQAAVALKSATATIPIVFVAVGDPVGLGLVQSLSRPGGNITGLATFGARRFRRKTNRNPPGTGAWRLENCALGQSGQPNAQAGLAEELPRAARKLGVALPIVEATTAEELDIAFASAAAQHADAIIVFGDALTVIKAPRVIALAAKHRLPAIYLFRQFATMAD